MYSPLSEFNCLRYHDGGNLIQPRRRLSWICILCLYFPFDSLSISFYLQIILLGCLSAYPISEENLGTESSWLNFNSRFHTKIKLLRERCFAAFIAHACYLIDLRSQARLMRCVKVFLFIMYLHLLIELNWSVRLVCSWVSRIHQVRMTPVPAV